jgi:addiction module HigA family antidote
MPRPILNGHSGRARQELTRIAAPSHPSALLREVVLPASGLNQSELAQRLNVSRRTVNMILNEQRPVTPDLAHRLGRFFGNGPRLWLHMQRSVDLRNAEQENAALYQKIKPIKKTLC